MTNYFLDETNRISVTEDGFRVGDELYALEDIQFALPGRFYNWEGVAVYFGVAVAIFIFTSSWILWLIGLGSAAIGIKDLRRARHRIRLSLHSDNETKHTAKYEGKGAKEAVYAIHSAILEAQADLERLEGEQSLQKEGA